MELQAYLTKYFEQGSPLSKTTPEEEAKIAQDEARKSESIAMPKEVMEETKEAVESFTQPFSENDGTDMPF